MNAITVCLLLFLFIFGCLQEKLKNEQDNRDLLKVKAKLFEDNSEPDKALAIYLRWACHVIEVMSCDVIITD
jgi:hypothetical protein